MRFNFRILVAVALATVFSSTPLLAIEITQVRVDKSMFRPDRGEVINVSFVLSEPATSSLHIYDGRDWLVNMISAPLSLVGEHTLSWDGTTQHGELVPAEAYRYTISAVDNDGQMVVHDLTDATAGENLTATDVRWDTDKQIIEYRLSQPSRVNIRVGLQNFGPLMRTVIDWVPRAGGFHQEHWDGMDQSSVLDLNDHPNLQISVNAYALGANTILVGPPSNQVNFIPGLDADNARTPSTGATKQKRMHVHSQQPLDQSGDIRIGLEITKQDGTDKNGMPVLSGQVPLSMKVAQKDRELVLERRFEPVFYVDGAFTFENEVGYLPFTWIWDTAGVNDGVHYVTANLRGYEGNFGMTTIMVRVDNHKEQFP